MRIYTAIKRFSQFTPSIASEIGAAFRSLLNETELKFGILHKIDEPNIIEIFRFLGSDLLSKEELSELSVKQLALGAEPSITSASIRPSLALNVLYESSFSRETGLALSRGSGERSIQKHRDGVFYTPINIVNKILRRTVLELIALNPSHIPTVFDPACGGGIFVVQSCRRIVGELPAINGIEVFSKHYGIDKDRWAVFVTRLSLLLEGLLSNLNWRDVIPLIKSNIVCGNTLLAPEDLKGLKKESLQAALNPISLPQTFPTIKDNQGFDVVIGNPPYGISRDQKIDNVELSLLKSKFNKIISGKPNKYILFFYLGLELAKPDGYCGMVIPNSWLGIKSGEPLRKELILNTALKDLLLFDEGVFKDPALEAVVLIAKKGQSTESFNLARFEKVTDPEPRQINHVPFDACKRSGSFLIPTNWSEKGEVVLKEIFENSVAISSYSSPFSPKIALQAYAVGKGTPPQSSKDVAQRIYDSATKIGPDYYPYLDGGDVGRFRINWKGKYLRHGPFLAEAQPIERYTIPRVLIREILNPLPHILSATYTDEPYLYNRSILHILLKDCSQPNELLLSLCGILNSRIGSFIISYCGRKSQRRLFPKLVNDDLKDFPIPARMQANFNGTAVVVRDYLRPGEKNVDLEKILFNEVCGLYGLATHTRDTLWDLSTARNG